MSLAGDDWHAPDDQGVALAFCATELRAATREAATHTVPELRRRLKAYDAATSGNKDALVARLVEVERSRPSAPPPANARQAFFVALPRAFALLEPAAVVRLVSVVNRQTTQLARARPVDAMRTLLQTNHTWGPGPSWSLRRRKFKSEEFSAVVAGPWTISGAAFEGPCWEGIAEATFRALPAAALARLVRLDLSIPEFRMGDEPDHGDTAFASTDCIVAACSALTYLDLSRRLGVRDIAPLAGLSRLQDLRLSDLSLSATLAPLAQCTSLTRLDLSRWAIDDGTLAPLASFPALRVLKLQQCAGGDMPNYGPGHDLARWPRLPQLSTLTELDVSGCTDAGNVPSRGFDLAYLSAMTSLETLDISSMFPLWGHRDSNHEGPYASDLSPLSTLLNLRELRLQRYDTLDLPLSPLANLPRLETLDLRKLNIYSPMTNKERVCLDLSELAPATTLKVLLLQSGTFRKKSLSTLKAALPGLVATVEEL